MNIRNYKWNITENSGDEVCRKLKKSIRINDKYAEIRKNNDSVFLVNNPGK